jgi:SH3 domain protein
MRLFPTFLALLSLAWSTTATAETMYVTDILRLGLHRSAETNDQAIKMLVSGTELDVLERARYAVRVRTEAGDEGWVKVAYLVDEKPAQARLSELEAERNRLATEVEGLVENLNGREEELRSLAEARHEAEARAGAGESELTRLREQNETLSERLSRYRFAVPLQWLLLVTAAALTGGFVSGWWWVDRQSRKRHGGFRIY